MTTFYLAGLSQDLPGKHRLRIEMSKCDYHGFDRTGDWTGKLKENGGTIMNEKVSIFLDSGAPSLYNKLVRTRHDGKSSHMGSHMKDRKHDDFSFIDTKEYLEYRRKYVLFIKEHIDIVDCYANLDVVNNAEATWDNQQYMENKGLKPIPVFHFGNDLKWLKMYIDKGYDYIAMGGIVPNPPSVLIPALDLIWDEMLTDKEGMPIVKMHGFAVTALPLLRRYPWYSVDSASWVKYGKYGVVCVPRWKGKKFRYLESPLKVTVSERSPAKEDIGGVHLNSYSPYEKEHILRYWEDNGWEVGISSFRWEEEGYKPEDNEAIATRDKENKKVEVETKIVNGLCNDYKLRDEANIKYYLGIEKELPEWPWAFKLERRQTVGGFFDI